MKRSLPLHLVCVLAAVCALPSALRADENDKIKEIAGTAEVLRFVPKRFATLQAVDATRHQLTLLFEDETTPRQWPLTADAEVKVAGWWGRLDEFQTGDRVWVWLRLDRAKKPIAVSLLTDELSEQDIHGSADTVERIGATITLKPVKGKVRNLQAAGAVLVRGTTPAPLSGLTAGEKLYVQSSGDRARLLLDAAAFEARREQQKELLRSRWTAEGLPGTVTFLHEFSGEMEVMLDHEAMRWGRSLKRGDSVKIQASPPIEGVVKEVRPWRERTQLRLVVRGYDQTDLRVGQRIALQMTPPAKEVETGALPPDLDRARTRDERVEWFLASIYCTCQVAGDTCTGDFYTLASCNPNACGMPNAMRRRIADKIDQGKTDKEIFEELLKDQGPALVRPHLLP